MRTFIHIDARSVGEACKVLGEYDGRARLNAGGTDLLTVLKGEILPEYPEAIVNIKKIPGLDYIKEEDEALRIGSLALLTDVKKSPLVGEKYTILAQAARSVATPQIRNTATVGGNLCQDVRCWYYRYPGHMGAPIGCARKGNGPCLAIKGDNRYHAIMGARKCFAVCPSDMAVALVALDARLKIMSLKGERTVPVEEFFDPLGNRLHKDEMVREIEIPRISELKQHRFLKFTLRKPIDFAIVSVGAVFTLEGRVFRDARIALGAVAAGPVRAREAEAFLSGRSLDRETAERAAELSCSGAKPLSGNGHKVAIAKSLIIKSICESGENFFS